MKMFKSGNHKNVLKAFFALSILNNNSVEKNINKQQGLFFSFLKKPVLKNKKMNN